MVETPLTYKNLTGHQKIAIFLLAVGEDAIQKIFAQMDDDEIREISIAMAGLGKVGSDVTQQVLEEFSKNLETPVTLMGSFEGTEKLLQKVLPASRQKEILDEIQGPAGRTMWDKLENVNEEVVATYLKNEYPQTVAVILSRLNPTFVAKVMAYLPKAFATDVIMRLMRLENVQKDVLESIEQTLRTDFMSSLTQSEAQDGPERVAEIFNNLDRGTENRLMTALFERNREVAEQVRSLMFTFEDLMRLDDQSIQMVLRHTERGQVALALKGASEQVKNAIMRNMSERARVMLAEDMEAMGAVRLRDVDKAQSDIVLKAKELAVQGDILIPGTQEVEEMVE